MGKMTVRRSLFLVLLKIIAYRNSLTESSSEIGQNLDLQAVLDIRDGFSKDNNYFGFTMSLVEGQARNESFDPGWVFIGAPKSNLTEEQSDISYFEPGVIWRCKLGGPGNGTCEVLPLTNQICNGSAEFGECDSSFMGGSLEFLNGIFISCAPTWKRDVSNSEDGLRMDGACYWMRKSAALEDDLSGVLELNNNNSSGDNGLLIPFKEDPFNIPAIHNLLGNRWYYAGAGTSAHISANKDIILGAPGVFGSGGAFINLKYSRVSPYQQWKFADLEFYRNRQYYLYNLGYAVTSGNFQTKDEILLAASSPRVWPRADAVNNWAGVVLIVKERSLTSNTKYNPSYRRPTKIKMSQLSQLWAQEIFIVGEEYGSYFGASLESVDINNDGLMELLVGAPFENTDKIGKKSSSRGDHGCVYIYSLRNWKRSDSFKNDSYTRKICGDTVAGRFGTSIAQLGDLNQDGYNDFAVGAPYGEEGGAVYIYWGDGDFTLKHIKISGSNYYPAGNTRPFGFGYSLRGGVDIDGNGTPDFGVGNYLSKNVIIFRTRKHMEIISHVQLLENGVEKDVFILEKNARNFTIEVCVSIELTPALENHEEFPTDGIVIWGKVEVDREYNRFLIRDLTEIGTNFTISEENQTECKTFEATRKVVSEDLFPDQEDVPFKHILWYNATENKEPTHLTIDKSGAGQPTIIPQGADFEDFCSSCPYPIRFEPREALEIPFRKDRKRREVVEDYPACSPILTVTMKGRYGTKENPSQRVEHEMALNFGDSPWLAIQVFVRNSNQTAYSPRINLAWKWENTRLNLTIPALSVPNPKCKIYKENSSANCRLDGAKSYLGKDEEQSVGLLFNMNDILAVSPDNMRFSVDAEIYLKGDTEFVPLKKSFGVNYLVNASLGKMDGVLSNVTSHYSNSLQYRFKLSLPGKSPLPLVLKFLLPESVKINGKISKIFEIKNMLINGFTVGDLSAKTYSDGKLGPEINMYEKELNGRTRGRKTLWGKVYDVSNCKELSIHVSISSRHLRNLDILFPVSIVDYELARLLLQKEGSLDFHGFGYANILGNYSAFNISQIIINPPEVKGIPAWVFITAVVVGLILLLLFIVCLVMCRFFKRTSKDKLALLKAEMETEDQITEAFGIRS